jgi:hypothetical protein
MADPPYATYMTTFHQVVSERLWGQIVRKLQVEFFLHCHRTPCIHVCSQVPIQCANAPYLIRGMCVAALLRRRALTSFMHLGMSVGCGLLNASKFGDKHPRVCGAFSWLLPFCNTLRMYRGVDRLLTASSA